jgi:hypothetical protein
MKTLFHIIFLDVKDVNGMYVILMNDVLLLSFTKLNIMDITTMNMSDLDATIKIFFPMNLGETSENSPTTLLISRVLVIKL